MSDSKSKAGAKILVGLGLWLVFMSCCFLLLYGLYWWHYGPDSRHSWNPSGKTIEFVLPKDCKKVINASSGGNDGEMLLTYETSDGGVATQEYNKGHLFETRIIWKQAAP